MTDTILRPAIAMIELIFALVIMGIALMSAPMLLQTSSNSTYVVLQQESINQAVSRITMMLTYPWDENVISDQCIPPVLHVTNGDPSLTEVNGTSRRIGVPIESDSRTFKCGTNEFDASIALGSDGGDSDDLDDFGNTGLQTIQLAGGDYLENATIAIATVVTYGGDSANYDAQTISFTPSAGMATTNIKNISLTVTSSSTVAELDKNITMNAFSCNIGGIEYAWRQMP